MKVHNASNERKTAKNLFKLMVEVMEILRWKWKVVVVVFTTNASGESCLVRKMLLAQFPHLVCPDCFVHQVWRIPFFFSRLLRVCLGESNCWGLLQGRDDIHQPQQISL
jgi:hypothetical protein